MFVLFSLFENRNISISFYFREYINLLIVDFVAVQRILRTFFSYIFVLYFSVTMLSDKHTTVDRLFCSLVYSHFLFRGFRLTNLSIRIPFEKVRD